MVTGQMTLAEQQVVAKVSRRLIWVMFICTLLMSLDRTNIAFAGLQMNKALMLNALAFAFSVTVFNIGYILFEIPSNMMFAKFGARIWLPRILITWGILAAGTMFAWDKWSLYTIRFVLGAFEGGFLPGIVLYLSFWFPESRRAKAMGLILIAQAISHAVAPVVSGPLLDMDGILGIQGWQWLFLIEGAPTVFFGVFLLFYLDAYPKNAKWLSDTEKTTLSAAIAREEKIKTKPAPGELAREFTSLKMVLLGLTYFAIPISIASFVTWSPQIVRALLPEGSTFSYVGIINAIPAALTAILIPFWCAHSDRSGERTFHIIASLFVSAIGWLMVTYLGDPVLKLVGLTLSLIGAYSAQSVFFTYATSLMTAPARPVGIAIVSVCGLVGGSVSPMITGYFKDLTGEFTLGLLFVVVMQLVAALAIFLLSQVARPALVAKRNPAE